VTGSNDHDLLEIDALGVTFATPSGSLRAVDSVSLRVRAGTTVGIVGESGSGKSTVLRAAMGLLPDTAALDGQTRLTFDGVDLRSARPDRHLYGRDIAMIFQDPMTSLTPVMRVGRHIIEPLRYHLRLDRRAARKRALEVLREVGIPEPERRLRQHPHSLSGGMRQRVTIAIALSCGPKLLLADEPTTALDVTVQHQILNLLQRTQQQRGMAMVLVTHDLGVVASRTDEVVVMYGGRVVERAPTKSLFAQVRHPYTEALLGAIPRIVNPSHTTLGVIPGRSVSLVDPPDGCRFAPRCRYAQDRCLVKDPPLQPAGDADHDHACFFPVGTPEGERALEINRARGRTAAGLPVIEEGAVHGR
jgi:peptide/nickel transport system ATP-binding protein